MFADDVAECDETAIKLQQKTHIIDSFCCDTWMEINMDTTATTVFRNVGPLRRYEHWSYRGTQINVTSQYKYISTYIKFVMVICSL